MLHETTLSADLKIWHKSIKAKEIEEIIGYSSKISHDVGDRRIKGDNSLHQSTYVLMEILKKNTYTIDIIEEKMACIFEKVVLCKKFDYPLDRLAVVIKVYDQEFVSIIFSHQFILKLSFVNSSIVVENHA
jgi:hypothetical protein